MLCTECYTQLLRRHSLSKKDVYIKELVMREIEICTYGEVAILYLKVIKYYAMTSNLNLIYHTVYIQPGKSRSLTYGSCLYAS